MTDPGDPDPRTEPEHVRPPERPPAFKSELGVDTGIEVGLPILFGGVAVLFFAYATKVSTLWIIGAAVIAVGVIVIVRNRRL